MTTTIDPQTTGGEAGTVGYSGSLIRPDDQVRLTFELINGIVDPSTNQIQALIEEEGIWYVICFGSQHTAEATISAGDTPVDEPLAHRRAAPSRVSVEIPAGTAFTVGNLLSLASYAPQVDPRADGAAGDPRVEPEGDITSLEVPASLILSPPASARFTAEAAPITNGDVSELWRAQLTSGDGEPASPPTARAIARRSQSAFPENDLDLVVEQTTGPTGIPLQVTGLTLSSQGATIDIAGQWAAPLTAYHHRAINGRDIRVESVERGFLAPFGHAASLTTLTERLLRPDASGDLTASLVEDIYLSITQPAVSYDDELTALMPHRGRRLPFVAVTAADGGRGPVGQERIVLADGGTIKLDNACVLTRDGADLVISYTATDRAGQGGITFELPAVFVSDGKAFEPDDVVDGHPSVLGKLASWFAGAAADTRRELLLGGQAVAWADPSPRGGAGSVQATNRIRLELDRPDLTDADPADVEQTLRDLDRPAFYPGVGAAWVVDQSSASTFGGDAPETEVTVASRWLEHGIGAGNVDLGYLDLAEPTSVLPTTDALGMLATALNIGTFGQFLGAGFKFPEIGADAWAWNPLDALGGLPTLLGALDLTDLIESIDIGDLDVPDGLPSLRVEPQFDDPDTALPTGVCLHFTWEPQLRSVPREGTPTFVVTEDFAAPLPEADDVFDGDNTRLLLALTTCLPEGTSTFQARLERFAVQLPPGEPVVAVCFQQVTYENDDGSSSVDADIADWLFINALNWLEPLKDFLAGLLGNGATTFEGGIFVDYGLPIPGFSIGVLGVSGLRVDLGLDLPDSGASNIALAVGRRDDPFRITIMGFGGDGSFGLEVDARQIVLIEGSLAVTYELGVDVFLASASLSASLGVFVEFAEGEVALGAYVELRGSVSFIGLVELSGAVTVSLIYNVRSQLLRGVAAVTAEVSSIFGKKDVTHDVAVEVALGNASAPLSAMRTATVDGVGPSAQLSFRDHFSRPEWATYCAAFAA